MFGFFYLLLKMLDLLRAITNNREVRPFLWRILLSVRVVLCYVLMVNEMKLLFFSVDFKCYDKHLLKQSHQKYTVVSPSL